LGLALAAALSLVGSAAHAKAKLRGMTITTPRHVITLADSGLPKSIRIEPHETEIPLPERGQDVSETTLQRIGRGEQVSDLRLAVRVGEDLVIAKPEGQARARQDGANVVVKGHLEAEGVSFELTLEYTPEAAMFATLQCAAANVEVQSLSLQMTLPGSIDFVLPTAPDAEVLRGVSPKEFAPLRGRGTIWENAGEMAEERTIVSPGLLKHVFVGNGDAGFTFLTDGEGFSVNEKAPFSTLTREDDGSITWSLHIVNHRATLKGKPTIMNQPVPVPKIPIPNIPVPNIPMPDVPMPDIPMPDISVPKVSMPLLGKTRAVFALFVHPGLPKSEVTRSALWFQKPTEIENARTPSVSYGDRRENAKVRGGAVRADSATVYEAGARINVLAGPAGGDAESVQKDISDTYPIPLFRYYAGTHTALPALLRSNSGQLTRAGNTPKPDRMVLARAFLNGIAADIRKIAHVTSAARILAMMDEFGVFKDDGLTEVIPYWRAESYLRFGEEFKGDRFSITSENPAEEVYEVIYRRPVEDEPGRYKALVFLVNETDKNQSEQVYLFDAKRLLGAANSLELWPFMSKKYWQEDLIPPNSDWRKQNTRVYVVDRKANESMIDMEGEGRARRAAVDGSLEIYGPVYLPAHDFRVFQVSGETSHRQKK
jgi:hypothetical protein